jgi:hypothetical protein
VRPTPVVVINENTEDMPATEIVLYAMRRGVIRWRRLAASSQTLSPGGDVDARRSSEPPLEKIGQNAYP